jgi:hypothetical protein
MAAGARNQRRGVSLTRQSLILIGVAVLLVGGAAGFATGFKVEQNHAKSAAKAAKVKPQAKTKTAAQAAQVRLNRERACLAGHGLHWPKIAGKFKTQLRTPPAGVTVATYQKALIACYAAAAKTSRAPPTSGAAASTG